MSVNPITQRVRNNIIRVLSDAYPEALSTSELWAQLTKHYGCNHTFRRTHDNPRAYLPHGCTAEPEASCRHLCWQAQAYPSLRALASQDSVEWSRASIPTRGAYWRYNPDPDPEFANDPVPTASTELDADLDDVSYRTDVIDLDAPPAPGARVIDAHNRFTTPAQNPCRVCGQPGIHYVLPHVDHRRRKPWPQPYWLCEHHAETSTTPGAQQ